MQIWLDTINLETIKQAMKILNIAGITTNPAILSSSKRPPESTIKELLDNQPGHLAVQVVAKDLSGIIDQSRKLASIAPERIIVKIPVTQSGIEAISFLEREGIKTLATAIFDPSQVLLSVYAKTHYVAPYLGKISPNIDIAYSTVKSMLEIIQACQADTQLMAAAIGSVEQMISCLKMGVHAITIPHNVYQELLLNHSGTEKSLVNFDEKWQANLLCRESLLFA